MQDKRGFTLVEVMVALFVTSILLGAVYFVFVRSFMMNKEQNDYVNSQDALRLSAMVIESDIRKSSQDINIIQEKGCFVITDNQDNTEVEYCVSERTLYRNSVFLIDNVDSFILEDHINYVNLEIISNYNRKEIKHAQKIYFRR